MDSYEKLEDGYLSRLKLTKDVDRLLKQGKTDLAMIKIEMSKVFLLSEISIELGQIANKLIELEDNKHES